VTEDLPPDRGVSLVARQSRISPKTRKVAVAGAVGVAVVLAALAVNSAIHDPGIERHEKDTGPTIIQQTVAAPPELPKPLPDPPRVPPPPPGIAPPPQPPPAIASAPAAYVVMPASGTGEYSFDTSARTAPGKKDDADKGGASPPAAQPQTTQVAFKPSTIAGGKAGPAMRLTYMMMPQSVPCALDGAMESTLAGSIFCHTTRDVLSPDHVLLMPAGTQVVGTYKSDVKTGQTRMFAFAGSAVTKEGIPVPLDSQFADGMGRTGIPGEVDSHLLERFGASIAITAAQMATGIAQSTLSKGGNSYFSFSSGGGGNGVGDLSTEILRRQADIPPTIYVPPGAEISVVVDHMIDFSDAIKVRTR
jgi:type IV secretion system protein VirB10